MPDPLLLDSLMLPKGGGKGRRGAHGSGRKGRSHGRSRHRGSHRGSRRGRSRGRRHSRGHRNRARIF